MPLASRGAQVSQGCQTGQPLLQAAVRQIPGALCALQGGLGSLHYFTCRSLWTLPAGVATPQPDLLTFSPLPCPRPATRSAMSAVGAPSPRSTAARSRVPGWRRCRASGRRLARTAQPVSTWGAPRPSSACSCRCVTFAGCASSRASTPETPRTRSTWTASRRTTTTRTFPTWRTSLC